jgi:glutaredoxin 3
MAKITIYTTPTCHYCKLAKEYFKSKGLEWEEKNVATDVQAQQEMISMSGQLGVPVINIDGKVVVGFDRTKINQYLGL